MTLMSEQKLNIVETERGCSIAGTRITLTDVMTYLKSNRSQSYIAQKLGLTIEQVDGAIIYINSHSEQVEAEYQACLDTEPEIRQYWDDYNRDRFAKISAMPPNPEQAALRAKLNAWNDRINASA